MGSAKPWNVAASLKRPIDPEGYLRIVLSGIAVNQEPTSNPPASSLPHLTYIEETIARGAVTMGTIPPVKECLAIAHEGKTTLAMLKRRKGESLAELLTRLNHAIGLAHTEDIFTDEINAQ